MRGGSTLGHAVVIGASLTGLCAARVLSDFYDRVTLFDRDQLPDGPVGRATVPQDRHLHLLMARGAAELEALFPGLLGDMVAAGVPVLENRPDCIYFSAVGHLLGTNDTLRDEFTAYVPSRPHLEWQVRRRAAALRNVEIRQRHTVRPHFDADAGRVTGVLLDRDGAAEFVAADLVIDASGRNTRLPIWLQQWGFSRPREDSVEVGISYASQHFRLPDDMLPQRVVVASASREASFGLGMLGYEDGVWVLTTYGVAGAEPPRGFDEMVELAETLLPAEFSAVLDHAEPVGEVAYYRFPASRWRRYDRLTRFPAGIVPLGDTVASFNPIFGQGITMACLHAGYLRRSLAAGDGDPARRVNREIAKTTRWVWLADAVGDFWYHRATGTMRWWYRPVAVMFDQLLGAAETDPVLAEWFLRRYSLLDNLEMYMVPPPRLAARTVRHNLTLWLRQRRGRRPAGAPALTASSR